MSVPPVTLSSPSKNSSSRLSQAGNLDHRTSEVIKNVASDVKHSEPCDFDRFLRFFLSLCLDGAQRTKFEDLQTQIEAFQHERYAIKVNEDGANPSGTPRTEEKVLEEETQAVKERDKLLDGIFEACLADVLSVANDNDIRTELLSFANAINKSTETSRYKPYADLNNKAFDLLSKKIIPVLRSEAVHRLRTCRADPKSIVSMSHTIERKPDLIRTSLAVANAARDPAKSSFGEIPSKKFTWPQVLSCEEMKAFGKSMQQRISKEARAVSKLGFQFNTERQIVKKYEEIEPDDVVDVKDSTDIPTPFTQTSSVQTSTLSTSNNDRVGAPSQTGSQPKRPRSESTPSSMVGQNKKARSSQTPKAAEPIKVAAANVQLARYALEMQSFGPGVHHAINTLIIDEYLWVWYYDRQGIIRSDGISIIADFPRFLVLLLAFQRFTLEDWGVIPCLNPQALSHLEIPRSQSFTPAAESVDPNTDLLSEMVFNLEGAHFSRSRKGEVGVQELQGPVRIFLDKYLCPQPRCGPGRATAVFKATCGEIKLACKISNPEAHRSNEGDILTLIRAIAQEKEQGILDNLPGLFFDGDIKGCTTIRVRSILGLSIKGYRTLRVLIFPELETLSHQAGESFAKAWLDAVKCHAFLWKHGIEHGDPSLWNVMYDPTNQCGVLTDYDLSIVQWLPRIPGSERTGTIPFMATALLGPEYSDGNIIRRYHHELEAFFWILPFVFLAYKDGERDLAVELISKWVTSYRETCQALKIAFLNNHIEQLPNVQADFKEYQYLFGRTFAALEECHTITRQRRNHLAMKNGYRPLPPALKNTNEMDIQDSENLWKAFILSLEDCREHLPWLNLQSFIEEFKNYKSFPDNTDEQRILFAEMKQIYQGILRKQLTS